MPEGDTVARVARTLDAALSGRRLISTDFRVPALAGLDLAGAAVTATVPYGKHLLTRTDAGMTIHTHLKMEGAWKVFRVGQRWHGPGHQIRIALVTDDYSAVGYRLGIVDVVPSVEEGRAIGHLGPDILGEDFDLQEVLRHLKAQPERAIGEALLDQTVVAGIGNLYRNEVLFLMGIDPRAEVAGITDPAALLNKVRKMMRANLAHWSQTTTGNTRPSMRHWVFERAGAPCRRCGTKVESFVMGRPPRIAYVCPRCQSVV